MRLIPRRLLYRMATSDRFERAARTLPPLERRCYRRAHRYVSGTSLDEALAVVGDLNDGGMSASIDQFGEGLNDPDAIDSVVDRYIEAAGRIAELEYDAYLEVVPSHLGLDVSVDFLRRRLDRIVEALPSGSRLEVSAEESWRTDGILEAVLALARQGAPVMATLQANLKRSERDAELLAEARVPVRLVKGAYLEPADVAHPWGERTDLAFLRLARRIHDAGIDLAIATHDPVLREALLTSLEGVGVEMLLGVRAEDARRLVESGQSVRIYVPFGEQWFRYWVRRLAEARGA